MITSFFIWLNSDLLLPGYFDFSQGTGWNFFLIEMTAQCRTQTLIPCITQDREGVGFSLEHYSRTCLEAKGVVHVELLS
ncbi:MAG: hypothetical protein NVSMB27_18930 [Ktedonobacteraceae bacterium]